MLVRQSGLGLEPQCGRIDCISGEEALVYRHGYNGDVVAFKMGRRQGKRAGGSAYWRIGVSGDAFSQRVAR